MLTFLFLILNLTLYPARASGPPAASRMNAINRMHDQALFPVDAPSLVEEMTQPEFLKSFAKEYCGLESPLRADPAQTAACDTRLKQALVNALASRYFALNRKAIEARCKREELACMDPKILELWARDSHNAGIESSRKEKLARLK